MHHRILKTDISKTNYAEVCDHIQMLVRSKKSSYIVAANVHVVMMAYWQSEYRHILAQATIVTPDGMPLVWGMRLIGMQKQSRVYGPDLMLALCSRAMQCNLSVYLYGGTLDTLEKLSQNLQDKFPRLKISGVHSPPFRSLTIKEEQEDAERINRSNADIVLVGLGCPKQEKWMYRQLGQTNTVMIGVGAAFRFFSNEVQQAPQWMMNMGLEWLFRLIQEPQRLWIRYALTNPTFVVLFSLQIAGQAISSLKKKARGLRLSR